MYLFPAVENMGHLYQLSKAVVIVNQLVTSPATLIRRKLLGSLFKLGEVVLADNGKPDAVD